MIESRVSVPIELGDLVLVDSYPCIYVGQGKGTIQFYSIWQLSDYASLTKDGKGMYIRKRSIGAGWTYRIVKYIPELLNEEYKEQYEKALEGLELLMKNKKK